MHKIKNTLKRLWQDESGQGATEYILLLAVLIVIVTMFRNQIKDVVKDRTQDVGGKLSGAIGNLSTP